MNKKAWIAMLLAMLMLLSLISCAGDPEASKNDDDVSVDEVGNGRGC